LKDIEGLCLDLFGEPLGTLEKLRKKVFWPSHITSTTGSSNRVEDSFLVSPSLS